MFKLFIFLSIVLIVGLVTFTLLSCASVLNYQPPGKDLYLTIQE